MPERVSSLTAASDTRPGTPPSSLRPWNGKSALLINLRLALFMSHYHILLSNLFRWLISFLFFPPSLLLQLKDCPSPFSQLVLTQRRVSSTQVQTLDWQSAAAHTTAASCSFPVNPVYWTTLFLARGSEVVRRSVDPEA